MKHQHRPYTYLRNTKNHSAQIGLLLTLLLFSSAVLYTSTTPTGLVVAGNHLLLAQNGTTRVNLAPYFEREGLTYLATENEGVAVVVEGNELVLVSDGGYLGATNITVLATDGENTTSLTLLVLVESDVSALEQLAQNSHVNISAQVVEEIDLIGYAPVVLIVDPTYDLAASFVNDSFYVEGLTPAEDGVLLGSYDENAYRVLLNEQGFTKYANEPLVETMWYDDGSYNTASLEQSAAGTTLDGGSGGFGTMGFSVAAVSNITDILLNTSTGNNRTNENLTLSFNGTDADSDGFLNITNWLLNGGSIASLYLPLTNRTGNSTVARDYTPFGNNGTVRNAVFTETGGFDGKGGYTFDGSDTTLINVTDTASLDHTGDITVEFWVQPGSGQNVNANIISKSSTNSGWVIELRTGTTAEYYFAWGDGGSFNCFSAGQTTTLTNGEWQHMAFVKQGTNVTHYRNGNRTTNCIGNAAISPNTQNLNIGRANGLTGRGFRGNITQLRIWNRSLTTNQVTLLFHNITTIIDSNETTTGEIWTAQVTPTDGNDGTRIQSNNVTIRAAILNITSILLNTSTGNNRTIENLTLTYNGDEGSAGGFKNITNWYHNGSSWTLLHMPTEGGSNSTFTRNYAASGINGTPTGTTFNSTGGFDGRGAYDFDGSESYISIADSPLWTLGSTFSIVFWTRIDAEDATGPPFISHDQGGGNQPKWILLRPGGSSGAPAGDQGRTAIHINTGSSNEWISGNAWTPTAGAWVHLAVTRNGSTYKFYRNGAADGEDTGTLTIADASATLEIGRAETAFDLDGSVDEMLLINRTLTPEQILAIYQNRTDVIVDTQTFAGDVWFAEVTPNDNISDGATVRSNAVAILPAQAPPLFSRFSVGDGTNPFNQSESNDNVSQMVLANANATIRWNFGVNASEKNFDRFINFTNGFVTVNVTGLDSTINQSANVTLKNVSCDDVDLFYQEGVPNRKQTVIEQGAFCNSTSNPSCTNILCVGTTLNFTVSHFTGFAAGVNANLTIFDQSDTEGGGFESRVNAQINFSANYTNTTSQAINGTGILCNITFPVDGLNATMTFNSTFLLYTFNRTFANAGTVNYNITCDGSVAGFSQLTANDSIVILGSANVPNITNILLNTSTARNLSTENLTLSFNGTDANGDGFINITTWLRNGGSITSLYLPLTNRTGNSTVARDYTLFGNNGTVRNAVFTETGGFDGKGGYTFDGSDTTLINISNTASLNHTGDITLEFWVQPGSGQNSNTNIIDKRSGNTGWTVELRAGTAAEYYFAWADGGTFYCFSAGQTTTLTMGEWQHIAFVKRGANVTHYRNGNLTVSCVGSSATLSPASAPLFIGRSSIAGRAFRGNISQVRIWNRSLTTNQVNLLFSNITTILDANETTPGDIWAAQVTPTDGEDGLRVQSNNITILQLGTQPTANTFEIANGSANYTIIDDLNNVTSLRLVKRNVSLTWNFGVNVSQKNIDSFVNMTPGFVVINTTGLDTTWNQSTRVSMSNISDCSRYSVFFDAGVPASRESVINARQICNANSDPTCTSITCINGVMNFTASHFTGFAVGINSNLTIYDQTDIAGGEFAAFPGAQINFTANYTNFTGGVINGTNVFCNITFFSDGLNATMTFNSTFGLYKFNRTFTNNVFTTWNATCDGSAIGYGSLTASDTISVSNGSGFCDAGGFQDTCTINSGKTILPANDTFFVNNLNITTTGRLNLAGGQVTNLTIRATGNVTILGTINASAAGHQGTEDTVYGGSDFDLAGGTQGGAGGGHGGRGFRSVQFEGSPMGGAAHDSSFTPRTIGAEGGSRFGTNGGPGGGLVTIHANALHLDGQIRADGLEESSRGGGGAGGAVFINVSVMNGTGNISAKGGDAIILAGAGGGGKIAVHYDTNLFTGYFNASGGNTSLATSAETQRRNPIQYEGTVVLYDRSRNSVIIPENRTYRLFFADKALTNNFTFVNFTIARGAQVDYDEGITENISLNILDTFTILGGGVLYGAGRGHNYTDASTFSGSDFALAGGTQGAGGGGYGGKGADGNTGGQGPFGDPLLANETGAEGGNTGSGGALGGSGGGRISIKANITIIDGTISADGDNGTAPGTVAGGGAGGSVYINTTLLSGSGNITARGGYAGGANGGDGSGGRIALEFIINNFTGMLNASASNESGNGTIAIRTPVQFPTDSFTSALLVNMTPHSNNRPYSNRTINTTHNVFGFNETAQFIHTTRGILLEVGFRPVGGRQGVNLTTLVVASTNDATVADFRGVNNTDTNHTLRVNNTNAGGGIFVCPFALTIAEVHTGCPGKVVFNAPFPRNLSVEGRQVNVSIVGSQYRAVNLNGTGIGTNSFANLTIFDQNDTLAGGLPAVVNTQINFTANYTNATSGASVNGSPDIFCNITLSNSSTGVINNVNMSYNSVRGVYEFNSSFNATGTYSWNVTCSAPTFGSTFTNDTVTITASVGLRCNDTITTSTTLTENLQNSTGGTVCPVNGLFIGASNLTLNCAGFKLRGSSGGDGIVTSNVNGTTLIGCDIQGFNFGVLSLRQHNLTIRDTILTNSTFDSINLQNMSVDARIINNTLGDNGRHGITVQQSALALIANNTIRNITRFGIVSSNGSQGIGILGNTITRTSISLLLSMTNGSTVRDNIISNANATGITFAQSSRLIVYNNSVRDINGSGIVFTGGTNLTVTSNNVTITDQHGIYLLSGATNAFIVNNTVTNVTGFGIVNQITENTTIRNNTITHATQGIALLNAGNATIAHNTLLNTSARGINIQDDSTARVTNNSVVGSARDVFVISNSTAIIEDNAFSSFNIANSNGTLFINQPLGSYVLNAARFTVQYSNLTIFTYLEPVTESGSNFTDDVQFLTNLVNVDSSNEPGLSAAANITFFNVALSEPTILRNGTPCPSTVCRNLSYLGEVFTFNVTGFTNYSLGSEQTPQVTATSPAQGATFTTGDSVTVSADVTDNFGVDTVLANISNPSGSLTTIALTFVSGNFYSGTYTATSTTGVYTIRYIANDSSGNVNASITRTFDVAGAASTAPNEGSGGGGLTRPLPPEPETILPKETPPRKETPREERPESPTNVTVPEPESLCENAVLGTHGLPICTCGNLVCDLYENATNCPQDCREKAISAWWLWPYLLWLLLLLLVIYITSRTIKEWTKEEKKGAGQELKKGIRRDEELKEVEYETRYKTIEEETKKQQVTPSTPAQSTRTEITLPFKLFFDRLRKKFTHKKPPLTPPRKLTPIPAKGLGAWTAEKRGELLAAQIQRRPSVYQRIFGPRLRPLRAPPQKAHAVIHTRNLPRIRISLVQRLRANLRRIFGKADRLLDTDAKLEQIDSRLRRLRVQRV